MARQVWRKVGANTMQVAGAVQDAAKRHKARYVVVDGVGIGAGVVDRLREVKLPCQLIEYIGGARSRQPRRYADLNAQCWWGMAEMFRKGTIDIENDRRLIAQIIGRGYSTQSDRTIRLESKDDIRKRGGRSPDEADALAMTFALGIRRSMLPLGEPF